MRGRLAGVCMGVWLLEKRGGLFKGGGPGVRRPVAPRRLDHLGSGGVTSSRVRRFRMGGSSVRVMGCGGHEQLLDVVLSIYVVVLLVLFVISALMAR